MNVGIFDLISLLGSLIFAIPVANFGVSQLLDGETTMGLTLLVVAVAMVVIPYYFLDPRTIARKLFTGLLPARFRRDSRTTDTEQPPKNGQ